MNGAILEAIHTSLGNAIHVNASSNSNIEAELVVFKECLSEVSLKGKGRAIYMNMTQFKVKLSFTRQINNKDSYQKQKSENVFRFIPHADATHPFNSKMKCCSVSNPFDSFSSVIRYIEKERPNSDGSSGRVETLVF
ncbi:MAG: hypothetical protein EZS28_026733 [Streblomastix strix]|uniref:Uncharacterized protein n=1 Tax=Streblomastix strix TaxID=222440 RepID=A0A5J4V5U2_9EUKA|nr:MAG: hypothetical protein EZS28_026733 [Streblomastix strix]